MPPVVDAMLAGYRTLLADKGYDWGRELSEEPHSLPSNLTRLLAHCDRVRLLEASMEGGRASWLEAPDEVWLRLLQTLPDPLPPGLAIVRAGRVDLADPVPFVPVGGQIDYLVAVSSQSTAPFHLEEVTVRAEDPHLDVGGDRVRAAEPVRLSQLRVLSDADCRWSIVDERGGGWFPEGWLHKYDYHRRPYFHGNDLVIEVPPGKVTVTAARGTEFRPATIEVDVGRGRTVVELAPTRLYEAATRGWYAGDLHVHLNYSGDTVATLEDAARMQKGEALHLMNLVAANLSTALVYDREAFEHYVGHDLPWSRDERIARWGVEYRNDLFGHFHVLNASAPPRRYHTGHARSDQPADWPPNAVAAAELREGGATIGYTHPVTRPASDDVWDVFDGVARTRPAARELVADAALGLVDSVDLTGIHNATGGTEGTERLYHRLLGCGLRLAATAGTDVMLSQSRGFIGSGAASNPPGWGRAYADLEGRPLSVEAWQDAVRAGRTFATNGPWLELDVAGTGPGGTLAIGRGMSIPVVARFDGLGVSTLEIVGPDGPIAIGEVSAGSEHGEVAATMTVEEPMWVAAVARGRGHEAVLGPHVYAHSSPVWIDVDGRSVARPQDAMWCIEWLDRFEDVARSQGNFPQHGQLDDLVAVLEDARNFYRTIVVSQSDRGVDAAQVERGRGEVL